MLDNGKHTTYYRTSEELEEVLSNPLIRFDRTATNTHTGEEIHLHRFRNLTLAVNFRLRKISVTGSLTTFIKGRNYENLSHSELVEAITILANTLQKKPGDIVTHRFEFQVVLNTPLKPTEYIDHLLTFKKKQFYKLEPPTWSAKPLQTTCSLEQFRIKVYDTAQWHKLPNVNLLKFEINFTRSAKGLAVLKDKGAKALTLAHFLEQYNLKALANFAVTTYQTIDKATDFQPIDYTQLSRREKDLLFTGKDPAYWKLERLTNSNYKKDRKRYLKLKRTVGNSESAMIDLERRLAKKVEELVFT